MHYIIVPKPILFEDFDGTAVPLTFRDGGSIAAGVPITIAMYLQYFVFHDTRLGESAKAAKAAKRIRKAFKLAKDSEVIPLEDADWLVLKDIVEKPSQPQPGHLASQLSDFMEAIVNAKDEAPVKPEAKANGAAEVVTPAV